MNSNHQQHWKLDFCPRKYVASTGKYSFNEGKFSHSKQSLKDVCAYYRWNKYHIKQLKTFWKIIFQSIRWMARCRVLHQLPFGKLAHQLVQHQLQAQVQCQRRQLVQFPQQILGQFQQLLFLHSLQFCNASERCQWLRTNISID